jgi:hypothetical protein
VISQKVAKVAKKRRRRVRKDLTLAVFAIFCSNLVSREEESSVKDAETGETTCEY